MVPLLKWLNALHLISCACSEVVAVSYTLLAIPVAGGAAAGLMIVSFICIAALAAIFYCVAARSVARVRKHIHLESNF
jgi:hypothetical protein